MPELTDQYRAGRASRTREILELKAKCERYRAALKKACGCRPGSGLCFVCIFLFNEDKPKNYNAAKRVHETHD